MHLLRDLQPTLCCLFVLFFYCSYFPSLGVLDANRPVPFCLTPNLQSFLSPIGINGPLYMSMVASARALIQPQYSIESILLALFRDEFIAWSKVSY